MGRLPPARSRTPVVAPGLSIFMRLLILPSSLAQLAVAGVLAWAFLLRDRPDAVAAMLVAGFALAGGLALLRLLRPLRTPRKSDPALRLNVMLLLVLAAGSALLLGIEHSQGAEPERMRHLCILLGAITLPSLVNAFALARYCRTGTLQ